MSSGFASDPEVREHLSIGGLAEATGISPATIRVWERRYGRPRPERLPSGHRRYPGAEVPWLRKVSEGLARGLRPSRLLRLSEGELDRLLGEGAETRPDSREVDRLFGLVREFAAERLRAALTASWRTLPPVDFLDHLVCPLVTRIGRSWAAGELEIRHEHLATQVLEDLLRSFRVGLEPPGPGPALLLATLAGERHGLGLEMLALLCAVEGIQAHQLGTDSPNSQIAAAALETRAAAVAVSVSLASSGLQTDRLLKELRALLPMGVDLVVGGRGARRGRRGCRGALYLESLADFREWLEKLEPGGGAAAVC